MCGIAGIISAHRGFVSATVLQQMADTLAHRGPDGAGCWINAAGNAGFGHRRLAVLDLSQTGAQPMHYLDRYTIVHNGEVYNYEEIKVLLTKKGYTFRSRSDTEVILAAFDCWGEACLQQFDGMFAFAIWDEQRQRLFAARDRFGEKPFYTCTNNDAFYFASEIKAFWAAGIARKPDEARLINYLALGYTQSRPYSSAGFFRDIFSLPPAHYLIFEPASGQVSVNQWWQLEAREPAPTRPEEAVMIFRELLERSVRNRLRSDVPVGTSLSGGLDSSSIVETITRIGGMKAPVNTFSAVFPGFDKDESRYIDLLADAVSMQNFRVTPAADELARDFDRLAHHQDEPFASSSIYAQYRVFKLARQQDITVLLDGQGADEILAGYTKYLHWFLQELLAGKKYRELNKEKRALRQNGWPFEWGWKNRVAARFPGKTAQQLEKREQAKLAVRDFFQKDFLKAHADPALIYKPVVRNLDDLLHYNTCGPGLEELLRYADRNAMAHGREARLPFLDHRLVEFVFSLPATCKIHEGWTKWLLRKTMDQRLPEGITWRKDKTGFEPPQLQWMTDKNIQALIRSAKEKLVAEKILSPVILNKKIQPRDAHAADNYDWRCLVAAKFT